jgi:hypothetical protein
MDKKLIENLDPEWLEGMDPAQETSLVMAAAMAHVKGPYRMVFYGDAEQCEWPQQTAYDMVPVKSMTITLPGWGGYVCIDIGIGWFSWGLGSPLNSAMCEYFADESIRPWTHNATGLPNITRREEIDAEHAAWEAANPKK